MKLHCCPAGEYPAIDRLLARKQAVGRLQCLRHAPHSFSPLLSAAAEAATCSGSSRPMVASSLPYESQAGSLQLTSPMNDICCKATLTTQNGKQQIGCRQFGEPNISELAHSQYAHFRIWRQQRLDSAITIQKHWRRFLAQQRMAELRLLSKHAQLQDRRILVNSLHAWRGHVTSQAVFR